MVELVYKFDETCESITKECLSFHTLFLNSINITSQYYQNFLGCAANTLGLIVLRFFIFTELTKKKKFSEA